MAAPAQLDSPHVIQIYGHGEHDGNLYLSMQLVQGPDLGTVIAAGPGAGEVRPARPRSRWWPALAAAVVRAAGLLV